MAIIKCKMCGGNLIPSENGFGVCDSCGLQQSLTEQTGSAGLNSFDKYISFKSSSAEKEAEENIEPLIKRVFLFLEDGNWKSADEYCEKVLDIDPEYGPVYLGKLMIEYRVTKPEYLANLSANFERSGNYQKAFRYGDETLKKELSGFYNQAKVNIDNKAIEDRFSAAVSKMNGAKTQKDMIQAAVILRQMGDYKNSAELADVCDRKAEEFRCEEIYNLALKAETKGDNDSLNEAINGFKQIQQYKDSYKRIEKCEEKLKLSSAKSMTKDIIAYVALAVFVIAKFICSAKWASYLDMATILGGSGILSWLKVLMHVIGLMALEVVLTSGVSISASQCKYKNFRLGGFIMFVITVFESFMMSSISCTQIFGEKFAKIFGFYFVFSIICNFTIYILMLICQKAKKSLTK